MVSLHPEYVVDDKDKRKAVVLPMEEWEKVIDELEELEDLRLYDAAKQKSEAVIPFEDAVREIEQDNGRWCKGGTHENRTRGNHLQGR